MEIDTTQDFTAFQENTILKMILDFLTLGIKILEIFQSTKTTVIECHKIDTIPNIAIMKGIKLYTYSVTKKRFLCKLSSVLKTYKIDYHVDSQKGNRIDLEILITTQDMILTIPKHLEY